jgi:3-oxoacyl-(acyl-carrier-protein) synthase
MKRRRVKITGIGPVTPAGIGREEFWKGILEPVSRVRPYTKLGEEFGPFVAAHIDRLDAGKYVDRSLLPKKIARHSVFAVIGAALALRDAAISEADLGATRFAVVTGSAIMDFGGILDSIDGIRDRGMRAALPRVLNTIGIGSAANAVSAVFGSAARTVGLSNQCISGLDAVAYAANLVATGEVDLALCGGTDAPLHRFPLIELRAAGLTPATNETPHRLSRPFDRWRTTGVVSEGACMFVLEAEESPRAGYSYVVGYGCANDFPDKLCTGMEVAGKLAMCEARIRPNELDVINAWGPGHRLIDAAESLAMRSLLGPAADNVMAVSIKGAIGMPLAAAPAMQIAASALAQKWGIIPPTVNWDYPDPDCALNLSRTAAAVSHRYTLINAHGFGAVNSSLILERC